MIFRIILMIVIIFIGLKIKIDLAFIISVFGIFIPELFREYERKMQNRKEYVQEQRSASLVLEAVYLEMSYIRDMLKTIIENRNVAKNITVKEFDSIYIREILEKVNLDFSSEIYVVSISLEIEYSNLKNLVINVGEKIDIESYKIREKALTNFLVSMEKRDKENNYKPTSMRENIDFIRQLMDNYRKDTNSYKYTMDEYR